MTYIPVVVPVRHEIQCIIQNGQTFCEKSNSSTREMGIIALLTLIWLGAVTWAIMEEKPILAIAIGLSPFILMIIFG